MLVSDNAMCEAVECLHICVRMTKAEGVLASGGLRTEDGREGEVCTPVVIAWAASRDSARVTVLDVRMGHDARAPPVSYMSSYTAYDGRAYTDSTLPFSSSAPADSGP